MKKKLLYFDTEFTGLIKNTNLISIGIVNDDNQFFYGEIKDFELPEEVDQDTKDFLAKEVYPGLMYDRKDEPHYEYNDIKATSTSFGNIGEIGRHLILWLDDVVRNEWNKMDLASEEDSRIRFTLVSDVMYYDMILFMDLLRRAEMENEREAKLKELVIQTVIPAGIDINDMIMRYLSNPLDDDTEGLAYEAFDMSREELLSELGDESLFIPGKKHNSLYDARVIQKLYHLLKENT